MSITLHVNNKPVVLEDVECQAGEVAFVLRGKFYRFRSCSLQDGGFVLESEIVPGVWKRLNAEVFQSGSVKHVCVDGLEASIAEAVAGAPAASEQAVLSPLAPMPGLVRKILVKTGDTVKRGQALVV